MKKLFFILGVTLIAMTSCIKDEQVASSDGKVTTQLEIEINQTAATRADATLRYVVEAYYDAEYTEPAPVFEAGTESSIETTSGSMSMYLDSSLGYYFLLWADYGVSYDASDLSAVTLVDGEAVSEAWQGQFSIINSSSLTHSVTLNRAVAKVNFIETGEFYSAQLTAAYDGYSAFNVASGDCVGETSAFEVSYFFNGMATGLLNTEPLYVLAPVATSEVLDFDISDVEGTFTVSNVPVQANYVTNLNGRYSSLFESAISVDKDQDWEYDPGVAEVVKFVDPVFEAAVLAALGMIEGQAITADDALTLTSLDVSSKGITDLTGIEYFTNLTLLTTVKNSYSHIDVSKLNKLVTLKCGNNTNVVSCVLPEDPSSIETFYIFSTSLTELDLTKMTSLKTLYISSMPYLESVNLRNCTNLTTVQAYNCYGLQTMYLNDGQTNSGTWVFTDINADCQFIFIDEDEHEETYGYGEFTATW
ncbi:MAG: DUF6562 domain-containing protein [Rikenellaceae bacterium]